MSDSTAKLIADRLATALAVTVRAGKMPATPAKAAAVIELPGAPDVPLICDGLPAWEVCRFTFDARDEEANYEAAVSLVRQAIANLTSSHGETIGGVRFVRIEKTSGPYPVPTSDQNLCRIRAQFEATRASRSS